MKIFTIVSALFLSITLHARHAGEIEIVSHSGEQFFVLLNGDFQNHRPQSNVNFQAYANNWNNVRVIAADYRFTIDKQLKVRPNKRTTYRVINRKGFHYLQFVNEQPLFQGYGGCGTQPTSYNQCGNVYQTSCNNGYYGHQQPYGYDPYMGGYGDFNPGYIGYNSHLLMSDDSYQRLKRAVNNEAFSSDKLRVANRAAKSKHMTVDQIRGITDLFTFSDGRLKFLKAAYQNCVNKSDYFELVDLLTFSSDKEALDAFLAAQ